MPGTVWTCENSSDQDIQSSCSRNLLSGDRGANNEQVSKHMSGSDKFYLKNKFKEQGKEQQEPAVAGKDYFRGAG